MTDIHIVLETPQNGPRRETKKRPRLVTSCDNCRTKKLRCIKQERPNARCEACVHANIPCEFRDREQYLAERHRMSKSSGGSAASRSASSATSFPPNVHSYYDQTSDIHGASFHSPTYPQPPATHSMMYAADFSGASLTSPRFAGSDVAHVSNSNMYTGTIGVVDQQDLHPPLFDPKCPHRPNTTLMISFIDAFFHNGGDEFGFLYYDDIVRSFYEDSLSNLLATCIAAWAVRYNTMPEFSRVDGRLISAKYASHAKELLASPAYRSSLTDLHSVIILAWLRSHKIDEFCGYAKLSGDMLRNFQAGGAFGMPNDQLVLDRTWSSVNHLVTVASKQQQLPSPH